MELRLVDWKIWRLMAESGKITGIMVLKEVGKLKLLAIDDHYRLRSQSMGYQI